MKGLPYFWTVPAGTPGRPCREPSCHATIYFVKTGAGAMMPVACNADKCMPPTATEPGLGISHYGNCTKPDRFRQPKRREVPDVV